MKKLIIDIDFPSCKLLGFSSDDFEKEIRNELGFESYDYLFNHSASPTSGHFPYAWSKLTLDPTDDKELNSIQEKVEEVASKLKNSNFLRLI